MPKQNRVTPRGEIIATAERGLFMGNRGRLHDAGGRIERLWEGKRWIICLLAFGGRKRTVMAPGQYTELFFLDEATAIAAGHRPCFECQRSRFTRFCDAWRRGNPSCVGAAKLTATIIDNQLHTERTTFDRSKRLFDSTLAELPGGVFVLVEPGSPPYLVCGDRLLEWTPGGYRAERRREGIGIVQVLTPESSVRAIQSGFSPGIHPTASPASS